MSRMYKVHSKISVKSTIEGHVADVQDMRDYSVKKVQKHITEEWEYDETGTSVDMLFHTRVSPEQGDGQKSTQERCDPEHKRMFNAAKDIKRGPR